MASTEELQTNRVLILNKALVSMGEIVDDKKATTEQKIEATKLIGSICDDIVKSELMERALSGNDKGIRQASRLIDSIEKMKNDD